ncbi:MAG: hypothetical protein ABI243_00005, partial [Lapillicoccus sp.]
RLRVTVTRGTVRVTNAGRSTIFAADDVVVLEPTARGVRFVIEGRDPVIAYAVPCPRPDPGERPRWLEVAEAVAGEDPARVAIIRRRQPLAFGVRDALSNADTTAYRFTGSGGAGDTIIGQQVLWLLRPRLHRVLVTLGPTDDWPADLRSEVATRSAPQTGRRSQRRGRHDGRLADLILDLGPHRTDGTSFALLLRLAPWAQAFEARSIEGSPAAAVFDRCRDAQFLLTDAEHADLVVALATAGLARDSLVPDGPREP